MAKSSEAPAYDANGRWVEERGRIKGAIRRVFRLSPQMKEVLAKARVELPPKLKMDGTPGKKNQVRYKCACCGGLFPQKWVQVDHVEPVVPLYRKEVDMSYDEIARGIMCGVDNLQVICSTPKKSLPKGGSSCHAKKTNEENFIRDYLPAHFTDYGPLCVERAKEAYQVYLAEQAWLAEEKLQRKLAREAKKKGKQQNVQQPV